MKILILLLLLSAGAWADECWLMRVGGKNFQVIRLMPREVFLQRPKKCTILRGGGFQGISAETKVERFTLEEFAQQFRLDPGRGELTMIVEGRPYYTAIVEKRAEEPPLNTEWPANGTLYCDLAIHPNNPEMARLFAEDQADRKAPEIDWKEVTPRDVARRARVRELLRRGELRSGTDFHDAAFIFQHGNQPSDYLLAHTLAMVAVTLGDRNAMWIACATLDRYLQAVSQPQIFGTQYRNTPASGWTQQPMDEELVSDALREQLGVPVRSEQLERLEKYKAR